MECPGITAWFQADSGTNLLKPGKYVVGTDSGTNILNPGKYVVGTDSGTNYIKTREICSRYRYITHFYCLAVEAGFYCGPGSIPTSGSLDFFAPCDTCFITSGPGNI